MPRRLSSRATPPAEEPAPLFGFAQFHPEWRLMTWHPTGVLDDAEVDRAADFIESQEKVAGTQFNRYTDLSGYSQIAVNLDHLVRLARRRAHSYKGPAVKSAFYAVRLIGLNIANMYEELMHGTRIQICTFRDRALAAEWLGVPLEILRPPKQGRR